jgi:transposase-like protein
MNLTELNNRFPEGLDAVKYFEFLRWGLLIKCTYCNSSKINRRYSDYRFHCGECSKVFSVTSGTFLHGTRIPLKSWLYAFSIASNLKNEISIRQLQRDINVSYTTAWLMYKDIVALMKDEACENKESEEILEHLCKKVISSNMSPQQLNMAI